MATSDPGSAKSPNRHRSALALGTILFGIVIATYIPAMRCGFIWDDDDYILENRSIQTIDGLSKIWLDPRTTPQYYPLVHSMFWTEHRLWGLSPTGYHVVNVLLHAASTVVVWRLLVFLQIPGAWFAAALFGVHPVHVESVAWITERKNVLSGLLYLIAFYHVFPLFEAIHNPDLNRISVWRYPVATLLFVGALLSKSVTCSLPAACLLVVYWKWGSVRWRDWRLMLPWFVIGFACAMNTARLERDHVGATGDVFSWTFMERCWIAGLAVWFYLAKLFWPRPLVFFYPRWNVTTASTSDWLLPICAGLLPVLLWFTRGRIGRGPLVAVLFFGGTLLPALGFVNVYPMRYSFVADHFQYLASLGPIVLFASCVTIAAARFPVQSISWPMVQSFLLLTLSVLAWRQEAIYQNVETLWSDVLVKNPKSFAPYFHLGKVRTAQGRHREASDSFRESLRLQTDDSETHITLILLGNSLARQGEFDEAKSCLEEALRRHPDDWEAIHGLATIAGRQGRNEEAQALFREVLALRPDDPVVRMNLGNSLAITGNLDEAIGEYQAAIKLRPHFVDAIVSLANVHARRQQFVEAEQQYLKALRFQPDHTQAKANLSRVRTAMSTRARP